MNKTSITISIIVFQFLFFRGIVVAQKGCIFFYKPYTNKYETNLYKKTQLKFDYKTQYNNLKRADVNYEIKNAIKHNDYRFIAISGVSYLYPGLEGGYEQNKKGEKEFIFLAKKYEPYITRYKVKVIEGTSDAINKNLLPLQSLAYDYAQAYNKLLLLKNAELGKKTER
jgi:hypothetical protein